MCSGMWKVMGRCDTAGTEQSLLNLSPLWVLGAWKSEHLFTVAVLEDRLISTFKGRSEVPSCTHSFSDYFIKIVSMESYYILGCCVQSSVRDIVAP